MHFYIDIVEISVSVADPRITATSLPHNFLFNQTANHLIELFIKHISHTMSQGYADLKLASNEFIKDYQGFLCDAFLGPECVAGARKTAIHEHRALCDLDVIKSKHRNEALSVALLSLTKSGKSTFLNALLGRDCMPMGTVPETARICRIVHDRTAAEPVLTDGDDTVEGSAAVRRRLHELNDEVRQREHCLFDEEPLSITAPLAALADQPPIPTELHLLDTPGPNEAGEEGLRYQVERLLDGVGVLVYLLDCSKLKTQEEEQMFRRLQEINPQLLQRLSKRLFFLVNKKDVLSDDDMSERDVQEYVAALVTAQMGRGDFQLDPDHVMLMSAKTALYSRMVMSGTADEQQMQTFAKLAFGAYGAIGRTAEECREAAPVLMEASGIKEVEKRLLTFLYSHSGRIQLLGTLDDVSRHISLVSNRMTASEAALKKDFNELEDRVEGMTRQLETVQGRFSEISEKTSAVEADVIEEVIGKMQTLKERLFEQVDAVLNRSSGNPFDPPSVLKPKWKSLWAKVQRVLQPGETSTGRRSYARSSLLDLHRSIETLVESEVRDFWHELEAATNSRQKFLFDIINEKLQELAAEAEGVLSHRLDVRLEPAKLSIEAPSFSQQHSDFAELFSKGIVETETEREEVQVLPETVIERRYVVPMCRLGEYYVAKPVTTRRKVTVKETHAWMDLGNLETFFLSHISSMVEASMKSVVPIVHKIVHEKIDAAKSRLAAYCTTFDLEVSSALDVSLRGEEERRAALRRAVEHSCALHDLKQRLELLINQVSNTSDNQKDEVSEDTPISVSNVPIHPDEAIVHDHDNDGGNNRDSGNNVDDELMERIVRDLIDTVNQEAISSAHHPREDQDDKQEGSIADDGTADPMEDEEQHNSDTDADIIYFDTTDDASEVAFADLPKLVFPDADLSKAGDDLDREISRRPDDREDENEENVKKILADGEQGNHSIVHMPHEASA